MLTTLEKCSCLLGTSIILNPIPDIPSHATDTLTTIRNTNHAYNIVHTVGNYLTVTSAHKQKNVIQ